jgi:hypothetical protein
VKLYKPDNLAVGDLVRHILYPVEEWAAVVLEIEGEPDPLTRKSRVLLCMLPGVKNEYFFKYRFRKDKRYKNDKIGWLSINWLRKYSS